MLHYIEITSLQDARYDDWLNLYQTAFPVNEQMPMSSLNRTLRRKEQGEAADAHFLLVQEDEDRPVGMARYDLNRECRVTELWYLAVDGEHRGRGLGSQIYQEILRRAARESEALIFEVEDPETAETEEARRLAERRIVFYQRNGAKLLTGIRYVQSVGWQPPIAMQLMVHPFHPVEASQAFALVQCAFGRSVEQIGALGLV